MANDGASAFFPASFDPITNGHLDVAYRALRIFGSLTLGVAVNVDKVGTFSPEERVEMIKAVVGDEPGISVTAFNGLTVDYARRIGAHTIIRGVRAMSDFEYEFEMALMNQHLYPEIETVFMLPSLQYMYVSSSRLKELVRFGRDVEEFVPALVAKRLREQLASA
jgi:pantetheine-phosphate adenylyltransferase